MDVIKELVSLAGTIMTIDFVDEFLESVGQFLFSPDTCGTCCQKQDR